MATLGTLLLGLVAWSLHVGWGRAREEVARYRASAATPSSPSAIETL